MDEHKSLRILHITGSTKFGGDTIYLLSLCKKAKEKGWSVEVETNTPEVIAELQKIDVKHISIPEIQRNIDPLNDAISFMKLYRYMKKNPYHIVHTHTSKGGFLGRITARIAGVPIVVHTVQGFAFHEFSGKLSTVCYAILETLAAKFCDMIISVNEHDRKIALKYGITSEYKITTIMNGLSRERIPDDMSRVLTRVLQKEFKLLETEKIVGATVRLSEQKGIEYFLKAIPHIVKEYKNIKFILVGDGPLEMPLKLMASELGIQDKVIFTGFRSDIPTFLALFDIFVLPSLWEGFSVSLLEAMAAGLPIIATDIKGNREALTEKTGVLIPPKDEFALANAVMRMLHDEQATHMLGKNAKERFYAHFTEDMMLEKTWTLYEMLVTEKLFMSTNTG